MAAAGKDTSYDEGPLVAAAIHLAYTFPFRFCISQILHFKVTVYNDFSVALV